MPDRTPLRRAQDFTAAYAEQRQRTIHNLRTAGWTYDDACQRADELEASAFERWERDPIAAKEPDQ